MNEPKTFIIQCDGTRIIVVKTNAVHHLDHKTIKMLQCVLSKDAFHWSRKEKEKQEQNSTYFRLESDNIFKMMKH